MSRQIRSLAAIFTCFALLAGCASTDPSPTPPAATATPPSASPAPQSPTPEPLSPTPLLPSRTASASQRPPTHTPSPTASAAPATPAATPATPARGIVVTAEDIGPHLEALDAIATANGGLRASGLPGYDASAEYVAAQLESYGFAVEREGFSFPFFDEATPVRLTIDDRSWAGSDWLHAMLYSAAGDVSGVVEPVALAGPFSVGSGGCEAADWSDFTAGHIAVLASGPCMRRDQLTLAQEAGAVAMISIYPNWEIGQTRRPTLLSPDGVTIPAIVAGQEPTSALLEAIDERGTARVEVETILNLRDTVNVIAELPGTSDRVVMLGGHLDSVLDGPGINDNASGVAVLLALAESLSEQPQLEATVRFGFWASEEFGVLGSVEYVGGLTPGELRRIDAYVNLDMVGSPNAARFVYDDELAVPGSSDLTDALLAALDKLDAPGERFDTGAASDHFAFIQAGIRTGGVFSGLGPLTEHQAALFGGTAGEPADPCYHLSCDTFANVNVRAAVTLGQAVADVLEELVE